MECEMWEGKKSILRMYEKTSPEGRGRKGADSALETIGVSKTKGKRDHAQARHSSYPRTRGLAVPKSLRVQSRVMYLTGKRSEKRVLRQSHS